MDELVWLDEALQDLDEIGSYIALDNPKAAENVIRRIVESVSAGLASENWTHLCGWRHEKIDHKRHALHCLLSHAGEDRGSRYLPRRPQMAGPLVT
ncbi:type II toxin-antitoxin system RelE/ParE family toxin [Neorhizobium lilium]|uniref:Type II toxin-antitoxin system RelE/ParE family toxin n=1 Tax=Neorhizobium lilium TaxID=2503024 RepID=A0A444LGD3_9HYPH|nr:type II toxin-antitoxin system RelE/ParE family toxin [Neorhizobium lilium]